MRKYLPPMLQEPSGHLRGILTVVTAILASTAYFVGDATSDGDASAQLASISMAVLAVGFGFVALGDWIAERNTPFLGVVPALSAVFLAYQAGMIFLALISGEINPNWGDRVSAVVLVMLVLAMSLIYLRSAIGRVLRALHNT